MLGGILMGERRGCWRIGILSVVGVRSVWCGCMEGLNKVLVVGIVGCWVVVVLGLWGIYIGWLVRRVWIGVGGLGLVGFWGFLFWW